MPAQLFQKDASHYQYEYRVEPISRQNPKLELFAYRNFIRVRGRKKNMAFLALLVAKNDILKFLLTKKNGEDFVDLLNQFQRAVDKVYNSNLIMQTCNLIYTHAFKYRHFVFIQYFMQFFPKHLDVGFKYLCKSYLKQADFLRMFYRFKTHYEEENNLAYFQKLCAKHCVTILKNYNWTFFKNFVTIWQDSQFREFIALAGDALKRFVSRNKFIRLLHECYDMEDAQFVSYYKKELTYVVYLEYWEMYLPTFRFTYAVILFIYGANKFRQNNSICYTHITSLTKESEIENLAEKTATTISLLYCFQKRHLGIFL